MRSFVSRCVFRPRPDDPERLGVPRNSFLESWRVFVSALGTEGGVPLPHTAVLLGQARRQLVRLRLELGMV